MDELSRGRTKNANEAIQSTSFKHAQLSERKGRPDIHRDFINLTSQVQMMSESLASCQIFRKRQSLRKKHKSNKKPGHSTQEERLVKDEALDLCADAQENDVFVSYMVNERDFLHLRKSKTSASREEMLTKRHSEDSVWSVRFGRSPSSASQEFPPRSSEVGMYDYREVDSARMIGLLLRELKTLTGLAPSVTMIASTFMESLSHCQECRRCHEKISSSLPWILNRIQKLIKYVTTRRHETYFWPNDLSYLRVNFSKSSVGEATGSSSRSQTTLVPATHPRIVGKLEKVDPIAVSEDNPGVQILLELEPEHQKKKIFYPARPEDQPKWVHRWKFPVVHLKEHKSAPVVQVLRAAPKPRIVWERKRQVALLIECGTSFNAVYLLNPRFSASVAVAVAKGRLVVHENPTSRSFIEPSRFVIGQARSPETNSVSVLAKQNEWNVGRLPRSSWALKPNAKDTFSEKFQTTRSELVGNSFSGAEEMHSQRVNELEEEVKELKALMLEVHKNQTELGKLLLEKKVFSHLLVKLTDPKMLDEESKAVNKASKINAPSASSSTIALQVKVDCLKRKCTLKNKLIMTLLRALRSNVPKEVWEEVVACAFDDSESVEEFDSEKVNEFIRQTSLLLTSEEKERKLAPSPSRAELLSAEEEPKVMEIMGAEVEDNLKNLSCYENQAAVKTRFEGSPSRFWAFPILNVPDYPETAMRKLENQISILNMENERLWHQINELRELLRNSINEMNLFESERRISSVRTSGKTINLVIQIGERDARDSKGRELFPEVEMADARSKSSPLVGIAQSESITEIHEAERENSPTGSDRKFALFATGQNYAARVKSDRRRSENDLNNVDDVNVSYKREDEKLRSALRERTHSNSRAQGLLMRTPHPSAHEMFQNFKPVVWVPSKHVIPEVSDAYGAGPSRKHAEITNLAQKPSLTEVAEIQCAGMYASMSNERELQTIPENDPDSSPSTSRDVSQAIQRLRTRVRSLHKDMTVLRSKNDRIDKLLERLMDDVVENNHNYEELESSLSSLKSRLG